MGPPSPAPITSGIVRRERQLLIYNAIKKQQEYYSSLQIDIGVFEKLLLVIYISYFCQSFKKNYLVNYAPYHEIVKQTVNF